MKKALLTVSQIGSLILTLFGGFYTRIAPPEDAITFWPGFASLLAGVVFLMTLRSVSPHALDSVLDFDLADDYFPRLVYL